MTTTPSPSSPYTAYGWQPAPVRRTVYAPGGYPPNKAPPLYAMPVKGYPYKLAGMAPRPCAPYKPARRPTSGRAVLVVLGVFVGLPVALVAIVCAIAAGVATVPVVAAVLVALAVIRPKWGRGVRPAAQAQPRRNRRR